MFTTVQYLDAVKVKLAINSDYQLSRALHLTRAAISAMRCNRCVMSDETAVKVAEILGLPAIGVIAAAHLEQIGKTRRPVPAGHLELWERVAKKAAGVVALLIASAGCWSPSDVQAAARAAPVLFIHYAQKIMRRVFGCRQFNTRRPALMVWAQNA
jgi:hypothetical protein